MVERPEWQTNPDAAYAEALRRIKAWGGGELTFSNISALGKIPPEISELTELRHLTVGDFTGGNKVSDLSPVRNLAHIKTLVLSGTQVSDLSPISGWTGVHSLGLNNSQVSDLSPISGWTGVQNLYLSGTQLSDLSPISGWTGVQNLYLDNSQVTDLSPISGWTGVQILGLSDTQVSDLSPISGWTGVQNLYLTNTQVSDLSPISEFSQLEEGAKIGFGLHFEGIPANAADPELDRISKINNAVERTTRALEHIQKQRVPQPDEPAAQQPTGRMAGITRTGQVGFISEPSDHLSDHAKSLRAQVLRDLEDAEEAAAQDSDNIAGVLGEQLSLYRAALNATADKVDAAELYHRAKKIRANVRAERLRSKSDFEECHYKAATFVALEEVERSHNAFASAVPELVLKDRAGLDPADQPTQGAAQAAKAILDVAVKLNSVFDESPLLVKPDMERTPVSGPDQRDQDEALASTQNLMVVATTKGLAELKQVDPKPLVQATKPDASSEAKKAFEIAVGTSAGIGFAGGAGFGAANFVAAYRTELLEFAQKMPGTQYWQQLINYVANLVS